MNVVSPFRRINFVLTIFRKVVHGHERVMKRGMPVGPRSLSACKGFQDPLYITRASYVGSVAEMRYERGQSVQTNNFFLDNLPKSWSMVMSGCQTNIMSSV